MLPEVHQQVDDCVAYGAWGAQRSRMVSIAPDASATTERAIHGAGEPDCEAADARGEGACMGSFRKQVDVVGLHGELDDTKVGARGRVEGTLHRRKDAGRAQAAERRDGAQRDVHGMRGGMRWPGAMGDAGAAPGCGFPSSAAAASAPGAGRGQRQLERAARHFD
jgi:hypothetical protein